MELQFQIEQVTSMKGFGNSRTVRMCYGGTHIVRRKVCQICPLTTGYGFRGLRGLQRILLGALDFLGLLLIGVLLGSRLLLGSDLFRLALVGVLVIVAILIVGLNDFGCSRLRLGLCLLNRYMNGRHITIRKTAVVERSRKGIRSGSTSVIVSMPGNRFVYCLLRNRRCCLLGGAFSRCDRL